MIAGVGEYSVIGASRSNLVLLLESKALAYQQYVTEREVGFEIRRLLPLAWI